MGQSLVKNYVHIIFSTKHRKPYINSPIESELHQYLGGICNKLECQVLMVGGYVDHVHILCVLSKKIALMKLVEELKSHSSKWVKQLPQGSEAFFWQNGYAAISVAPNEIEGLKLYIEKQHEHHRKLTFREELLDILKQYNIPFDERYIWD